jgi:hypothetical protein
MPLATRLPGIQFDVVAPPAPEAFVRMDIAVFVGFAASGPLQQPVAVEDIAHFEEIFGNDLVIANDPGSNQPVYACLPPAVRAFFRNGGSRCWVIRVAGVEALANRFPVPGVFELRGDTTASQAHARGRSEGSWSDTLAAGVALRSKAIQVASLAADPHAVRLLLASADDVGPGDLLKLTFGDSRNVMWLFTDSVTPIRNASPILGTSPGLLVVATGQHVVWQSLNSPLAPDPRDPGPLVFTRPRPFEAAALAKDFPPVCERLTMDMFVQGGSQSWSLIDLGFAPLHPRYWARLPSDAALYASDSPEGLAAESAHPRFPLAGEAATGYFLPLGVGPLPMDFKGPDVANAPDAITRDGLASFGPSLFLDPALADSSMIDLLREADYIRYQSRRPRTLAGIHAALAIEEATIIAVPDAVQRGWSRAESIPLASPPDTSPLMHPEWWHFLDCHQSQDIPRGVAPHRGQFEPCDLQPLAPPSLRLSNLERGRFSLTWTPLASAVDYLEEARDPGFVTAAVIYRGSSGSFTIYGRPPGDSYYRLRRQIGTISSDYSRGVGLRVNSATDWQVDPVAVYQDGTLLAVHRALLRMCAARGDVFAVLAVPRHYREGEAIAHAAAVKAALEPSEQIADSFGALYHPWLVGREENDFVNLRANPPDGAIAGIMAMRSAERGPWIAPANESLHGVVDLTPAIPRSSRQALQDALINLVRQEPGGFLCLCALTLSDDPDLSPISVRRLLSFLRKTALRAGVNYVFEPNSDEFRRGVQRGFENLLDGLLRSGAFAGRTAGESFQVVTDRRVNTPEAMDNGQFFVELRVAPSLPMRFLTIRLLQTADRTFVTEGR